MATEQEGPMKLFIVYRNDEVVASFKTKEQAEAYITEQGPNRDIWRIDTYEG